jgi:hypothetical protein
MPPERYLLQWKKRPHIIKVQPHSKNAPAGVAAKFTLKYYYETTVKVCAFALSAHCACLWGL